MSRKNNVRSGRDARANRQDTASSLQTERETRTPAEQVDLLDERLGKGQGAQRERARLERAL